MDREQRVCSACGEPVQSVVRRHKTLGAWVPRWVPGPCHNRACEAYVEPGAQPHLAGSGHGVDPGHASGPERAAESEEEPGAPAARSS
ncbi:hypothetical protein ACH47C_21160 [Streptomyces rishiriensis]|uniref:hypothetical protein n=1 Tax=Streptomyces rishiriensis TaxID=68264 RepID=UPI000D5985E7|nr:hypothetical protein [Streptomyces rishiriensis]